MKLNIPLERILYPPSYPGQSAPANGDDILAIKRVVARAGFWPWQEFNKIYSDEFALGQINKRTGKSFKDKGGVAALKASLGLKPDGVWNDNVHKLSQDLRVGKGRMHYGEYVWDQVSINLYKKYDYLVPAEEMVQDIFGWWNWMVDREPSIYYDQGRPISVIARGYKPPKLPFSDDCSGTLISCAWLAGAKSPDIRYQYSGYGNTDSLIQGGFHIKVSDIDKYCKRYYIAAFYGPSSWDTSHVIAVKNSKLMYSHGRASGPNVVTNIYYHPDPLIAVKAYNVL